MGMFRLVLEVLMLMCLFYSMWFFLMVMMVLLLCGGLIVRWVVLFGLKGEFLSCSCMWLGWLLMLLVFWVL